VALSVGGAISIRVNVLSALGTIRSRDLKEVSYREQSLRIFLKREWAAERRTLLERALHGKEPRCRVDMAGNRDAYHFRFLLDPSR
jgi:hypothetical protein